jgi:hypothetical protein
MLETFCHFPLLSVELRASYCMQNDRMIKAYILFFKDNIIK